MPPYVFSLSKGLFPIELRVTNSPEFDVFIEKYTVPQMRVSMWLAVCTFAVFGLWDVFGATGGIQSTRFRYLLVCPILSVLAAFSNSKLARTHRTIFLMIFYTFSTIFVFILVIIIDKESIFKLSIGNATINFCTTIFFGYGLLPLFIVDGIVFGVIALLAHGFLLVFFGQVDALIGSFYVFHTVVAATIGMFISYWREFSVRSSFKDHQDISSAETKARSKLRSPKFLISYRRSDADAIAGRIRDRLVSYFDEDSIFMDVDSIPIGVDFRTQISNALNETDAMLVIIGTSWMGRSATTFSRRIDDPDDPVRIEVELALRQAIPILPILVSVKRSI